jgi:hypothetical protein
MAGPDRKAALLAQDSLTGIDFVSVAASQQQLDVYFLREPSTLTPALAIAPADVTIVGEDDPSVPITGAAWAGPFEGRTVLRVTTARPGDFGRYWLTLAGDRIDPFFRTIELSFKAACPRDIDCAPPPHLCPADPPEEIVVDGSARDFWSLRTALLGFANQRNPRWQDRLEADVGVMLVELMSALGDELAYYQDRVARETHFEGASQRRSLRRHARLVDYELADGLGARGWLAIEAQGPLPPPALTVPAGTQVWARSDGGRIVAFEIGRGMRDLVPSVTTFAVDPRRNKLAAHLWEGDEPDPMARVRPLPATCLPAGATSLHVQGHVHALFSPGDWIFLVTEPPADQRDMPVRRQLVTLVAATDETDPLGGVLGTGADVTRLVWKEPTRFELNLAWLSVLGNVVPVTAGETLTSELSIGPNASGGAAAIERVGADGSVAFLHTLPDRDGRGLVRLGDDPHASSPEIDLVEIAGPGSNVIVRRWSWRRALIGSNSAEPEDTVFTLDDGSWQRAVGYRRLGGEIVHYDYIANVGTTVRFGDGEFGRMPVRGSAGLERWFRARYRLGNGVPSNLPADTLRWASSDGKATFAGNGLPIASVTNPLPTRGGVDAETLDEARRDAPEAFRTITYRAVRPEDYDELAERVDWVQRAGTQFRWTGSWTTAFTTADPRHQDDLPVDQRVALTEYLDRFRMAGRDVHVLAPRYANLELEIRVCVAPGSYPSDVEAAIRLALIGRAGVRPIVGFFDPDHFTFGTPLDRSELEAAVQRVHGVRAVERIWIARPGFFTRRRFLAAQYRPGVDEVIRVDNDPRHPDRGSISITTEGGA